MIHNLTSIFSDELLGSLKPGSSLPCIKYEGWYGTVYKIRILGNTYALKIFKPVMHDDIADRKVAVYDYEVLKTLNHSPHYPTLHAYKDKEWMLVDWVDALPIRLVPKRERYSSQLHNAYQDAVNAGWFPDDVKGDNLVCNNETLMIIDVGSFLPVQNKVNYCIDERVEFVMKHAHKYPSVRDKAPYNFKEYNLIKN